MRVGQVHELCELVRESLGCAEPRAVDERLSRPDLQLAVADRIDPGRGQRGAVGRGDILAAVQRGCEPCRCLREARL